MLHYPAFKQLSIGSCQDQYRALLDFILLQHVKEPWKLCVNIYNVLIVFNTLLFHLFMGVIPIKKPALVYYLWIMIITNPCAHMLLSLWWSPCSSWVWSTGLPVVNGTCAEAALRFARCQLGLSKPFVTESIIGTRFAGSVIAETLVGSGLDIIPAVIPVVNGSAYITGFPQFVLDDADPFPEGFRLRAWVSEYRNLGGRKK